MHAHNAWGGSFDVSMADSATEDDNRSRDLDRASLQRLEETQQSWLLGPTEKKKKDQYVDLGCMVCKKKIVKYIAYAFLASALLTALIVMIVKLVPHHKPPPPPEDNYTKALHKTLLFFNAQKSGTLPKNNNVSWRHTSAPKDGEPTTDLSGGYYDAGDNIKFHFPQAYTITILSWSVIEYSAKYEAMGELNHVKELIKWGSDYLLKTFNHTADKITQVYSQVGEGSTTGGANNDHSCWERPEDMDYQRPVATCSSCSDLAGEIAAALAAASIVFKDSQRQYSQELVKAAAVVYQFARGPHARYSPAGTDAAQFYNSTGYWDEYVWSSAWLFFATGNTSYLQLATNLKLAKNAGGIANALDNRVFSWDNKLPGAQVLLTRLRIMINPGYPYEDVLNIYNNQTNINMCSYMPQFNAFNVTKGGLVQYNRGRPQPLQYNAAASFLAAVYADYLKASDVPAFPCGPNMMPYKSLRDFSRSQIDYILGNNPQKMSYIVGYGSRYPTRVHHRGASIPSNVNSRGCTTALKYRDAKSPNPHVLVGAMVAGPDSKDRFSDVRSNYNYTEPTLVANALVTAALVALSGGDTTSVDANALFSAVPPLYPPSPPPPAPWKP